MKLVMATQNAGKLKEMQTLLRHLDVCVISAAQAGMLEDIVEDGETFEENALKKACFTARTTNNWAVADDSGLCIEALDGKPGVHSARWVGADRDPHKMIAHVLEKMKHVLDGQRSAYFQSVLALVSPSGEEKIFTGRIDGTITHESRGTLWPTLPYDMVFVPGGFEKTFAEMSPDEKNAISHRGQAFAKLCQYIKTYLQHEA